MLWHLRCIEGKYSTNNPYSNLSAVLSITSNLYLSNFLFTDGALHVTSTIEERTKLPPLVSQCIYKGLSSALVLLPLYPPSLENTNEITKTLLFLD
jgi:hypothetical protein